MDNFVQSIYKWTEFTPQLEHFPASPFSSAARHPSNAEFGALWQKSRPQPPRVRLTFYIYIDV